MYYLLPSNFVIFKVGLPNDPMGKVTRLHASFVFECLELDVVWCGSLYEIHQGPALRCTNEWASPLDATERVPGLAQA